MVYAGPPGILVWLPLQSAAAAAFPSHHPARPQSAYRYGVLGWSPNQAVMCSTASAPFEAAAQATVVVPFLKRVGNRRAFQIGPKPFRCIPLHDIEWRDRLRE